MIRSINEEETPVIDNYKVTELINSDAKREAYKMFKEKVHFERPVPEVEFKSIKNLAK